MGNWSHYKITASLFSNKKLEKTPLFNDILSQFRNWNRISEAEIEISAMPFVIMSYFLVAENHKPEWPRHV